MMADKYSGHRIVQTYWSLPYEQRDYETVAKELNREPLSKGITSVQVGRTVREWEEKQRVLHVVLEEQGRVEYRPLLPELEDKVRDRFGLRDVVVVDISCLKIPPGKPGDNREVWDDYDDSIHRYLGVWAGRVAVTLVRQGDVIGVGGGRAMYYTAVNCALPRTSHVHPRKVVSLTGQMTPYMWKAGYLSRNEPLPRSLDADVIAAILKNSLGARESTRTLDLSITQKSKVKHKFPVKKLTLAIVGIGSLAGGHRLIRYEDSQELQPVHEQLKELCKLIQESCDPPESKGGLFQHWVGDVCNSLFVLDNPLREFDQLSPKIRTQLMKHVKALNSKFINTEPEHLSEICKKGAVLVVAGGPHKVGALLHVLKHRNSSISHLVTDHRTAQYLSQCE
jgi:DNA-binding transcriptional regulator LsrR (DeoR family)